VNRFRQQADAAIEPVPLPTPAFRLSKSEIHNSTTVPWDQPGREVTSVQLVAQLRV
jgi:hypothetical protein